MVTILHISDLHFKSEKLYEWNSSLVLRELVKDIEKCKNSYGLAPDIITITGDIAFSGKKEEYKLAISFFNDLLKITSLKSENLFIIPGNHDINRIRITKGMDLISNSLDKDIALGIQLDPTDRGFMSNGIKDFNGFIRTLFKDNKYFNDKLCFFGKNISVNGHKIGIVGLNSAWCAIDSNRRQLYIGEWQIKEALKPIVNSDIRIALVHHPFELLNKEDANFAKDLLINSYNFDIILFGHLHLGRPQKIFYKKKWMQGFQAGSGFEARDSENGYNYFRINIEENKIEYFPRKWNNTDAGSWDADIKSFPNLNNGREEYSLRPPFEVVNFAVNVVDNNLMLNDVIDEIPNKLLDQTIRFILEMYLTRDEKLYTKFLEEVLRN